MEDDMDAADFYMSAQSALSTINSIEVLYRGSHSKLRKKTADNAKNM